jgi:hypothetical protein
LEGKVRDGDLQRSALGFQANGDDVAVEIELYDLVDAQLLNA